MPSFRRLISNNQVDSRAAGSGNATDLRSHVFAVRSQMPHPAAATAFLSAALWRVMACMRGGVRAAIFFHAREQRQAVERLFRSGKLPI